MRNSMLAWAKRRVFVAACVVGAAAFASGATGQEKDVIGVVVGTVLCPPIKLPPEKLPIEKLPYEQLPIDKLPVDLPPIPLPTDRPQSCPNTLAPLTLAVQVGTAVVATGNFTGSIFGRLDGLHQQGTLARRDGCR